MKEELKNKLNELENSAPLDMPRLLEEFELYDRESSQKIIDDVYKEFENGDNTVNNIVKPVFMSVVDGLLEKTNFGKAARRKGITTSRIIDECENFSYNGEQHYGTDVNAYTEYKNACEFEDRNSNMTQDYTGNRRKYEDKAAMNKYKKDRLIGEKTLLDEYTDKKNLYLKKDNPNQHYNDETNRKQAQPDHIVPIKQVHEKFKSNYSLDDSDIKRIVNIDDNFAVTSAEINQIKKEMSNKEYIEWMDEHGYPIDDLTRKNMLNLQKKAERAADNKANEIVFKNIVGKGEANEESLKEAIEHFKEENDGIVPTKEQKDIIKAQLENDKTKEIHKTLEKNAVQQAKDYAVGNVFLFIVKPIYYEIRDIIKNGITEGVNASSAMEALKIRFGRITHYVSTHAAAFIGDNLLSFVKGFLSSLVECVINLFVGMFKQILKIIKEGIKIFLQSVKILFGKNAKQMSAAEKGDAIIKLIGGSVIAVSGIGIESLLNKIGIGEPWSVVISTMLSGIASCLFMHLLDKVDLFSVKAEKRRNRIIEIYEERISDIELAKSQFDIRALEALRKQRIDYESISAEIQTGIDNNDINTVNEGLYKMADFMRIELPYRNTEEFVEYFDSSDVITI